MISVGEALERVLALVSPVETETLPLADTTHRVLAEDVTAHRDQPPFAASAMDGYAIRAADLHAGATFKVIGESAAGHGFAGPVGAGQAVRIFTGAPVPDGADHILIQEDADRTGDTLTVRAAHDTAPYIRPAGGDFRAGQRLAAPVLLGPTEVALAAAMNAPRLTVRRKPHVALIATGDELVMPGSAPGPDQIIASNTFGLKAVIEAAGGTARLLPIAGDTEAALIQSFKLAATADLIVTIGGASVGDHDLVGRVAKSLGMEQVFYKVAMRPGKPLMAGRVLGVPMLGLPGNPVSSLICGKVFMVPMIRALLGLPPNSDRLRTATLTKALGRNGPRAHYMRGQLTETGIAALDRQDSSLLSVLAQANVLILRDPDAPALERGAQVEYLPL